MPEIVCPYCDTELSPGQLEADGGVCPDCGHPIPADVLYEEEDDEDGDLEDDEEDE